MTRSKQLKRARASSYNFEKNKQQCLSSNQSHARLREVDSRSTSQQHIATTSPTKVPREVAPMDVDPKAIHPDPVESEMKEVDADTAKSKKPTQVRCRIII